MLQNTWELENRIRQKLLNPKHRPSPYDIAWVAMVPAQGDPHAPRLQGYVEWILQNQHSDGSWGLGHLSPRWLGKDFISSTLACILALKTWNIGNEHIRKGISTEVIYKLINMHIYIYIHACICVCARVHARCYMHTLHSVLVAIAAMD